jgi:hypothetical protein
MKRTSVWIYKKVDGAIYQIRVVQGERVTTIPVSNTEEKKLRRLCQEMYGRCQFTIVQFLPDQEASQ